MNITFPPSTDGVKHFSIFSLVLHLTKVLLYDPNTSNFNSSVDNTFFPGVWKLSSGFFPHLSFFPLISQSSHMALSLLLCQESQQPCYIPQQGHLRHTQHTDSSPLNSHKTIIEKLSRLETLPATKKGVALNNVSNCFTIEAWWRYQGRKDK